MKQLNIIHFSQDFAKGKSQLGGFSRIFNLCSDENQHLIFTITKDNAAMEEFQLAANINVVSLPLGTTTLNRLNQFRSFKVIAGKIYQYLRANNIKPDLLFGHSQIFNFYILNQLKSLLGKDIRLLWEVNVIWGIHNLGGLKGKFLNGLNRYFQKLIFSQADCIICQTKASKDFIIEQFNVDKNKCEVIPNAVFIDQPFKKSFKSSTVDKKIKVLCLGLFDKMNGIPFLVDVITKNYLPKFEFVFIGDGLYKSQVQLLHDKQRCTYLGKLPYKEMQKRYSDFDFVIIPRLPMLEADLFIPTKLVEAMYHGVIPICSNVLGMTEIIEHANNGFIFPAGNEHELVRSLEYIATLQPDDLNEIANNCKQTIYESYNWQHNYEVLAQTYSKHLLPGLNYYR